MKRTGTIARANREVLRKYYLMLNWKGKFIVTPPEVLRAEVLQEIYREIENLPDRCGQIFKLLFVEGLPTDQIAESLGINVQTIRTQKARAIGLIRTALLKNGRLTAFAFLVAWLRMHA